MKASTDVIYRVVDDEEDVALEVCADGEFINISSTRSKKSTDWFGVLDLNISKSFANELGKALIKASE